MLKFLFRILEGALIGLGAVLPGISGGVLCVIFGVYKPIMETLGNPFKNLKKHIWLLIPIGIGVIAGFLGIAKLLGFLLENYEAPSICLFVGLITGMLPSLFREAGEQGRSVRSYISLVVTFALILGLLVTLRVLAVVIPANFFSYLFCGFCLAISIIAPGMSFSTLLMPLGLYEPFLDCFNTMNFGAMLPIGIGAVITVVLFVGAINYLLKHHYSVMFHAIIGVVIAATIMTIPFDSFTLGAVSVSVNLAFIAIGIICALLLDKFNSRFDKNAQ